ncbi:hypothetical protein GW866_02160 [bacterium]|nr:hypothetical protein [bacterium]OIO88261.1 MAG: hypothetical protein AUK02_03980 [Anaerolineae bacterium CG2_30_58_95]PIW19735.1 MAG: hypothetical protein COW33_04505 [Anaerolineae bacterium CG17_big_fil_post_rev_8_21_14_2_50_57_27]PIX47037.1 MAG: hypothetical protein COZ54_02335 [Anaerolineae bacterium CG_4_8_14_3_um_filter_59_70]PJH75573.1 MAG: hypothetical protein CO064_05920 [Anaerolineae bacterium CG_4_9_14_0_8_um_filter_58_9]
MVKQIFSLWFCLCVLLSACMPQEVVRETIGSEEKLSTSTATEEKTPAELATSTLTGTPSASNIAAKIISPVFVFLKGDVLMEQVGSNAPEHLNDLPELGPIKDAVLVGETLYLLREQGIQRILLSEGTSDLVLRFDMPILWGGLIYAAGYSRIIYYGTESGQNTLIGYFDLDEDIVHSELSFPKNLHILGMTRDRRGLYCLPFGQDPEFNEVLVIDLEQGEISRELPVQGTSFATLAPDARLLATFAQRTDTTGQLESVVHLYDLPSLPLTPPRVFTLPNAPSYVGFGGLHWSPDSQRLYFMLVENIYEAPATTSYGLWSLAVESGATDQVAQVSDPIFHTISISPDGEWIVLMHDTNDEAMLVQLQTGEVESFSAPVNAIVAGWR